MCQKKGMGSAVCAGGWICAISLPKGGCTHAWVQKCDTKSKFHHFLFPDMFWVKPYPLQQRKGGVKIRPQKAWCVGLFAGQKWCISGNPGNTLSGYHLGVGSPSECSLPRHALSSIMVWNAGDGPWWAPRAELKKARICAQLPD